MKQPGDCSAVAAGFPSQRPNAGAARREVRSEDLFAGAPVVFIRHADAVYTLRRTSNGKLILTK